MTGMPEGQGTQSGGALTRVSPLEAAREETPGSAVPGRVVHCKLDEFDVYIGRPSKFGNPFRVFKESQRDDAIKEYEEWVRAGIARSPEGRAAVKSLYGKTLGCWCAPKRCHGEVLLKLAAEIVATDRSKAHGGI